MSKSYTLGALALLSSLNVSAASDAELQGVREQLQQVKQDYEQRISQLEKRLEQTPSAEKSTNNQSNNLAMSLILSGTYGSFKQNTDTAMTGFAMSAGENGATRGFSIKESELGFSANIDHRFRGVATFAIEEGSIGVENAYIKTTALGNGLNLKFGRFFSGIGYINEHHAHTWDFVDQALVYRSFWNNQLADDGVQLKWLAPSDSFVELGAELGRGERDKNGSGAGALFVNAGADINNTNSWRAGLSLHQTKRTAAQSDNVPDLLGNLVSNQFSGTQQTAGLNFVWKYIPENNLSNFKLQGEYFRRKQHGELAYDIAATNLSDSYALTQSGWYLQGIYQFMPRWRAGLRYEQMNAGQAQIGALNTANVISDYAYTPQRSTLMMDYSPSEFSRLRLQWAQDKSRQNMSDNPIFIQYIMSLGAHGAHLY